MSLKKILIIIGLNLFFLPSLGTAAHSSATDELLQFAESKIQEIQNQTGNTRIEIDQELCQTEQKKEVQIFVKFFLQDNENAMMSFSETLYSRCLREDLQALQDLLQKIKESALKTAENCTTISGQQIAEFQELYATTFVDSVLLRKFGDQQGPNGKTLEQMFKAEFLKNNYSDLKDFGYLTGELDKKINHEYFNSVYLPYSEENPQGCQAEGSSELNQQQATTSQNWEQSISQLSSPINSFLPLERIIQSVNTGGDNQNLLFPDDNLEVIRDEFIFLTKGNDGIQNFGIIKEFLSTWEEVTEGLMNLGEVILDSESWVRTQETIEELQQGQGTTQGDLYQSENIQQLNLEREKEIARMKAKYILLYSEVNNQISKSLEYNLMTADSCIQKAYTEGQKGQKLGCSLDSTGKPVKASQTDYSLPNFEKRLQEFINKQCGQSMERCQMKYQSSQLR